MLRSRFVRVVLNVAAWLSSVFPTLWGAVVSTVVTTAIALWTFGIDWLSSTKIQTVTHVFLAVLWTVIGVIFLIDRSRAREVYLKQDFRYGLTFVDLISIYDWNNEQAALQFAITIHNFSQYPLRFEIEKFSVCIDTRSIQDVKPSVAIGTMSRGALRNWRQQAFRRSHIVEFLGNRCEGTVAISIAYGPTEAPPQRRLKMSFNIYCQFPKMSPQNTPLENFGFTYIIQNETDEEISRV